MLYTTNINMEMNYSNSRKKQGFVDAPVTMMNLYRNSMWRTFKRLNEDYGNPFEGQPVPEWYTEEIRQQHWDSFGPRSCQDATGGNVKAATPREPPDETAARPVRNRAVWTAAA